MSRPGYVALLGRADGDRRPFGMLSSRHDFQPVARWFVAIPAEQDAAVDREVFADVDAVAGGGFGRAQCRQGRGNKQGSRAAMENASEDGVVCHSRHELLLPKFYGPRRNGRSIPSKRSETRSACRSSLLKVLTGNRSPTTRSRLDSWT